MLHKGGVPLRKNTILRVLFDFDYDLLTECLGNVFDSRQFDILRVVLDTGYCTFRCPDPSCQFLLSQSAFPPCFSQDNADLELLISGVIGLSILRFTLLSVFDISLL